MEPMLKDLQQAAEAIPCTQRWLADGLRTGRFPGHKIGRRWMLSEDNIDAALPDGAAVIDVMLEHTRRFGPAASASTPTRSSASCWATSHGSGGRPVSARERMDWDAYRREQQRQVTASMVEDFKRREEIRRQHVEDALAAMKPKPLARIPEEVAELCARLEHPKLAARDNPAQERQ